jgi:hypothetical protein
MRNTLIAAALLASAASPAMADTVTDYSLNAVVDIGLQATFPNSPPYEVRGAFVYDDTTASVTSWDFGFDDESGGPNFQIGTSDGSPSGEPFAQANSTLTSFEFWEGDATSYPNTRSFTFDIANPLFNGSEPLEDASYFGINESVGFQGLDSGTLFATTVDEPSPLILFAFGAIGWLGWRSQFSSGGHS